MRTILAADCLAAPLAQQSPRHPNAGSRDVKLFISYPSDQRDLAERLRLALEEEDHSVFTDRAELREGEAYHEALREAIAGADAMIFLITPRSVAAGSYALTELDFAQREWRTPAGRVLPVLVEPTPIETIPPYLRSVTLLQPKGDVVAETVAAVERLHGASRRGRWLAVAVVLLLSAAAGAWWWHQDQTQQARLARQRALLEAETTAASELCRVGNHAIAWDQFALVAGKFPETTALRTAREDCGMRWLREMRVRADRETFSELVAKVQPVLAQGLARSGGQRRADLRAHLAWGDFLRGRDGGAAADPLPQYEAALQDDPGNVYAHAMWAHNLAWTSDRQEDFGAHFDAAVRANRERPWVRGLQFSVAFLRRGFNGYALAVADDMRRQGEVIDAGQRENLWRFLFNGPMFSANERRGVLEALPAPALLATFDWLFPAAQVDADRRPAWRYVRALLLLHAGAAADGRRELEQLNRDLVAAKEDGRLSRAVKQSIQELAPG
jgi:hypothetical protein